ncbi:hypothetical protein, partial [Vibrio mediterranei]
MIKYIYVTSTLAAAFSLSVQANEVRLQQSDNAELLTSISVYQQGGTGNTIEKSETETNTNAILNGLTSFYANQNGNGNSAFINVEVDTGQADSGNWNSVNVNQHGNDNTSSIIVGDVTKPRELTLNHNVQGDSNTLNSSINANGRVSSSLMVNGNGNTIGHTVNISDTT